MDLLHVVLDNSCIANEFEVRLGLGVKVGLGVLGILLEVS